MLNVLVVGGAGYIGSHMCKYLAKHGYLPVVLDNLSSGHRPALKWGRFYAGALDDAPLLERVFSEQPISAVMHFAALWSVGQSVQQPARYYRNNVAATLTLLETMLARAVPNFIFSSTAATYGEPVEIPITETHPQNPINPYGRSKLMVEQVLEDLAAAHGLRYVSLRYFNVAGADPEGELGEDHRPESHLIPLVLKTALGQRPVIDVYGTDYPTKDGTCIRDYIHVTDLVQAHLLALERLVAGHGGGAYNLGNGDGYSVKQVIEAAREITGSAIPARNTGRRSGDAAVLIASSQKAIGELGWQPQFADLHQIIETAWKWHRKYPDGYEG